MTDDELREWAAPYVLGSLTSDERAVFEDHLGSCDGCRREVAALAPIPGLLARSSPPPGAPGVDGSLQLALSEVGSERRRLQLGQRRWRNVALGSVAAAIAVLVASLLMNDGTSVDPAEEQRVALAVTSPSATAEIDLLPREWGTVVDIHVVEVHERPDADSFTAWVVDEQGRWEPACSWALDGDGWARVQGASSVAVDDVAEVVVTPTDDRSVTLLRGLPSR